MLGQRRRTAILITALGITSLALAGCSGDAAPSADGESSVQEVEVAGESSPSTFADGVFESSLLSIRITDTRMIPPGDEGNEFGEAPVMAFWYETTNVSGQAVDPLTAWLTHVRARQDTGDGALVELTLAMAPDPSLMATQTDPIEAGATVANAVGYRLENDSLPVEVLTVDTRLNEIGTQTFLLQ